VEDETRLSVGSEVIDWICPVEKPPSSEPFRGDKIDMTVKGEVSSDWEMRLDHLSVQR